MSGRGSAGGDGFRVLEARLAEVSVEVEEARRDHDALVCYALRLYAFEPDDRFEDPVDHDDFARAFASGDGIDQPGLLELEPLHDLADPGPESRRGGLLRLRAHRAASGA